jgi:hypothetical protein
MHYERIRLITSMFNCFEREINLFKFNIDFIVSKS